MSRRLCVVLAHPDDDTFSISGTAALHADDPEFRLTIVLATSGDAGEISDPAFATRETLGAVREEEDRASWRMLGREPDRLEFLRFPDGGLADRPLDELVSAVAGVLREERPDVVVTFGPEGVTGHPDHITIGRATMEAFHGVRLEAGGGFRRLLCNAIPAGALDNYNEVLAELGLPAMDPSEPFRPRGVDDSLIAVEVDTSSVWPERAAALRAHRTQAETGMPEALAERVLSREFFAQPFPGRPPGSARLGDVFEGL